MAPQHPHLHPSHRNRPPPPPHPYQALGFCSDFTRKAPCNVIRKIMYSCSACGKKRGSPAPPPPSQPSQPPPSPYQALGFCSDFTRKAPCNVIRKIMYSCSACGKKRGSPAPPPPSQPSQPTPSPTPPLPSPGVLF